MNCHQAIAHLELYIDTLQLYKHVIAIYLTSRLGNRFDVYQKPRAILQIINRYASPPNYYLKYSPSLFMLGVGSKEPFVLKYKIKLLYEIGIWERR
jgi:hypothetical protein